MNTPYGSWRSSIVRRRRCRFWGNMSETPIRRLPILSTAGWPTRIINIMIRDVPRRWPLPVRSLRSTLGVLCPCTARPSCLEVSLTACPELVKRPPPFGKLRDLRFRWLSLSKPPINPFTMIADLPKRSAFRIQKASTRKSQER